MCVLSPRELAGVLGVPADRLDTSGLKLSLCEVYGYAGEAALKRGERRLPGYTRVPEYRGLLRLVPGAYLIRYCEEVAVPADAVALVYPRSSLLRMGATIHTAVWDPGYRGRGVGLLVVYNPAGIVLEIGAHVAQMIYLKMTSPAPEPYSGAYQGEGLG